MSIDALPPYEFNPGYDKQDMLTIPLELGLIWSANRFNTPRAISLINYGNNSESSRSTTATPKKMAPYGLGATVFVLGDLWLTNEHVPLTRECVGWLHSILLTELATSASKVIVQRKRPFFDTEDTSGNYPPDDKRSFFSGHASHSFNFATYSSLLMFEFSHQVVLSSIYSVVAYSAATYVSYTRIIDHAHHVDDVIFGAVVGTLIGGSLFYRVQEVDKEIRQQAMTPQKVQWRMIPNIILDDGGQPCYGASLEVNL